MASKFFDYYRLCILMTLHLDEKRSLAETRDALEYEECKGIFSGWKLEDLRREYEEKKKLLKKIEKKLLAQCPSLDILWSDLGLSF